MTLLHTTLSALAVASVAYAQCSGNPTLTIENSGDAQKLKSCETFTGNIAIATSVTDNISLDGIKDLEGDLVIENNDKISQISGNDLRKISGKMRFSEVQLLSSVNFGQLSEVGALVLNALPNLPKLSLSNEVSKAGDINIQNTQLNSLQNVNVRAVDTLYIANNPYLEDIDLPLEQVNTALTLEANSPKAQVKLNKLTLAYNMTFHNISSVSVPLLQSLNGSMGFIGNTMQSFTALNLTSVGGSLSFVSNTELTNITLPQLKEVKGGFQIANNTKLGKIDGVKNLKTVGGALDFNGAFDTLSLDSLDDVRGAFNLQTSKGLGDNGCDHFKSMAGRDKVIKGKFTCAENLDKPGGAGTTPGKSGNGPNDTGAAGHVELSAALTGVAAIFAFAMALF